MQLAVSKSKIRNESKNGDSLQKYFQHLFKSTFVYEDVEIHVYYAVSHLLNILSLSCESVVKIATLASV